MPQKRRNFLSHLKNAQILPELMAVLDDNTLMTVLRHFVWFRVSIPKAVVRRVFLELFGSLWEGYYTAYTDYHAAYIEAKPVSYMTKRPESKRAKSHAFLQVTGVWGAKFPLEFPWSRLELDGFATLMALETLHAIGSKSPTGAYSIQLTEPEPGSFISHVLFTENARHVIVIYSFSLHEWIRRFEDAAQGIERGIKETDSSSESATLSWLVNSSWNHGSRVKYPKSVQIWDIADSSCIWSVCLPCDSIGERNMCLCSKHKCKSGNCSRFDCTGMGATVSLGILGAGSDCARGGGGCPCRSMPNPCFRFLTYNTKLLDTNSLEHLSFKECKLLGKANWSCSRSCQNADAHICTLVEKGCETIVVVWRVKPNRSVLVWKDGYSNAAICRRCSLLVLRHWLIISCELNTQILDLRDDYPTPLLNPLLRKQFYPSSNTAIISEFQDYVSWIESYARSCDGGSQIVRRARLKSNWPMHSKSDNFDKRLSGIETHLHHLETLLEECGFKPTLTTEARLGGTRMDILVDSSGHGAAWCLPATGLSRCPLPIFLKTSNSLKQRFAQRVLRKRGFPTLRPIRDSQLPDRVGKRYFLTDDGVLFDMCPKRIVGRDSVLTSVSIGLGERVAGFFELVEGNAIILSSNDYKDEYRLWLLLSNGNKRRLRGSKIPKDRDLNREDGSTMWVLFSRSGKSMLFYDGRCWLVRFAIKSIRDTVSDFFVYDLDRTLQTNGPGSYSVYMFSGDDFLLVSSQPDNDASQLVNSTTVHKVSIVDNLTVCSAQRLTI